MFGKTPPMSVPQTSAVYDRIGVGYSTNRSPDPRWQREILAVLGNVGRVVNVGAGTGSYEPTDRFVAAVEPSALMLAQRARGSAPAVRAVAESLPFPGRSFEAGLAVLTIHHWVDVDAGLAEMRRVADRQVIVTWDPRETAELWLVDEYLPEIIEYERRFDPFDSLLRCLDVESVEPLAVPADCTDGFMAAYWRRPAAYLDPGVRASISSLSLLDQRNLDRAMRSLERDLGNGAWERRHRDLLDLDELDLGYKLVIGTTR
jgi:SAM-dependent methyltransferase